MRVIHTNGSSTSSNKAALILGCSPRSFPLDYLGLPLKPGRLLKEDWSIVIVKFDKILASWQGLQLSRAARITLINSVLTSQASYIFSLFRASAWVIKLIDKRRKTYLLTGDKSINHILFNCAFTKEGWKSLLSLSNIPFFHLNYPPWNNAAHARPRRASLHKFCFIMVWHWKIWYERNTHYFAGSKKSALEIAIDEGTLQVSAAVRSSSSINYQAIQQNALKCFSRREHSKRFKEEDMQVHMEGKNCMVTGANSGIGYATAVGLASRGATVYMICRNKERGEAAFSKIQSITGNQNIHLEICDLSSINGVKSFVSRFSTQEKPLHVLVNNAGLLEHNRVTTPEGLELNFAVNVAATYTLTELMMPLLEKAAPDARVITVSSGGMYTTPLTTDLQFSESNFDGTLQYARNKRVQVALTEKWAETYGGKGVGFYSMHPGWADTPGVAKSLPGLSERLSGKLRTNEEGADTVVWLALQRKEDLKSGAFYFDRAEAPKHLRFAGTARSHAAIDAIVDSLRSICKVPS
ncbi:dehydrogenase/reductase SDR family member 12 isoform X1 [Canna indica]|uniref:Dehydrogenase/reductase SDR family member 12 isoform X1 n=1 Tax=Canna indica TaxID=4628 RepID=A0AAQ3QEL5_9LILI|nr:dehydrogenase/reductase SDR family member 12 isoform X1 [Canna indica]